MDINTLLMDNSNPYSTVKLAIKISINFNKTRTVFIVTGIAAIFKL